MQYVRTILTISVKGIRVVDKEICVGNNLFLSPTGMKFKIFEGRRDKIFVTSPFTA